MVATKLCGLRGRRSRKATMANKSQKAKGADCRTKRSAGSQQRVVSVPRGYKRVAAQMDAIHRQFKDGASMTRLGRKHSLPKSTIEFIIRMKMLGHANDGTQRPRN